MKIRAKDFVTFEDISPSETAGLLKLAESLKRDRCSRTDLQNKVLAMIFQKPSTRTRVSFEVGMHQLGGSSVILSSNEMQLSRGETIEDTARTLSKYVDGIMARVFEHQTIKDLASAADIPVINGLSNSFHPCQTLADLMTIREHKGEFNGLKVAWIGDGSNVCNSMITGCAKTGMNMSIATPQQFQPDQATVNSAKQSTDVLLTTEPSQAIHDADVVMTDTFSSIHNSDSSKVQQLLPEYQINSELMAQAKSDAIFLHCLPAKRGQEVTSSVIDGPQSVIWDEAENRLHTQKALLISLLS